MSTALPPRGIQLRRMHPASSFLRARRWPPGLGPKPARSENTPRRGRQDLASSGLTGMSVGWRGGVVTPPPSGQFQPAPAVDNRRSIRSPEGDIRSSFDPCPSGALRLRLAQVLGRRSRRSAQLGDARVRGRASRVEADAIALWHPFRGSLVAVRLLQHGRFYRSAWPRTDKTLVSWTVPTLGCRNHGL